MEDALRTRIEGELLPALRVESVDPHEPVVVRAVPKPWETVGTGNYAAVFAHPEHPEWVVKVYAPGRPGIEEEREVYRRMGEHRAFPRALFTGENYLVISRMEGVTLYDAMLGGLSIPERVVRDVDDALAYARGRGLRPHDVHGRNVVMRDGRGFVIDISDFLHKDPCSRWRDLRRAYFWLYRPVVMRLGLHIPRRVMEAVRHGHRRFRQWVPERS